MAPKAAEEAATEKTDVEMTDTQEKETEKPKEPEKPQEQEVDAPKDSRPKAKAGAVALSAHDCTVNAVILPRYVCLKHDLVVFMTHNKLSFQD